MNAKIYIFVIENEYTNSIIQTHSCNNWIKYEIFVAGWGASVRGAVRNL